MSGTSDISDTSGGVIENMGYSPDERKMLFYAVCVPIRLTIVALAFKYENHPLFVPLMIMVSVMAIVQNTNKTKTWWNREVHRCIAISVLLTAVAGFPKYIKYLLLLDVSHGLISSFAVNPFK